MGIPIVRMVKVSLFLPREYLKWERDFAEKRKISLSQLRRDAIIQGMNAIIVREQTDLARMPAIMPEEGEEWVVRGRVMHHIDPAIADEGEVVDIHELIQQRLWEAWTTKIRRMFFV